MNSTTIHGLTDHDLEILRHSLGISVRKPKSYRNYYAANPGELDRLVEVGVMRKGRSIPGGLQYYHVTETGIEAANKSLQAMMPKLTRAQRRYQEYLEVAECFDSFLHWLQWKQYQKEKP